MGAKKYKLILICRSPEISMRDKIIHLNKEMSLNINHYPPGFFDREDDMALFMFDLMHFPTDMVIDRFILSGGSVGAKEDQGSNQHWELEFDHGF